MKLWLKTNLVNLQQAISSLIQVIVDRSVKEIDVIMPGYTHLQRAQPVRWSHYLLRYRKLEFLRYLIIIGPNIVMRGL